MSDDPPALRRILSENGWALWRHSRGDHDIWRNPATGRKVAFDGTIKSRHSANGVLKQSGLPKAF